MEHFVNHSTIVVVVVVRRFSYFGRQVESIWWSRSSAHDADAMPTAKVSSAEEPEAGSVTLLKEEDTMMAYCGAVTTITFFTGPAPVEAVRARVAAVVAANPWLAGRLVRGKKEKRMRLTFDLAGPLREGLFTVASPGQYNLQGVSYSAIQKVMKGSPLEVKGGMKAVNKDAVQMNVTVIPDGDRWALTLSISHTIADGHTYYQVYNMLSASAEVKSLNPVRKESFSVDLPGAVGKVESQLFNSAGLIFNMLSTMIFGGKVRSRCRLVDPTKLAAAKAVAKEAGDSAWVSTNDILTAGWGKITRAQLLEMSINFRNRLPGIGDTDAGNYELTVFCEEGTPHPHPHPHPHTSPSHITLTHHPHPRPHPHSHSQPQPPPGPFTLTHTLTQVFYQEEDCVRPGQIRKSISTPGKYMRCGRDPPRPLRSGFSLMRARYALITNWATFAHGLEMPGCEQRLHLPFPDLSVVPCDMAFVFRATSAETGVLMLSRKLQWDKDLGGSVLGTTVDPVIFPE